MQTEKDELSSIETSLVVEQDELGDIIKKLRRHWLLRLEEEEIDSQLKLYIPTILGKSEIVKPNRRLNGLEEIDRFLSGEERVMLLLGDSGSGKTLFGLWLVNNLWEQASGSIPLFLHLPTLDIKNDFLREYLLKYLSVFEVALLREKGRLFLFFDAYDEMAIEHREKNLYRMGNLEKWDVKVVISCRSEALVKYSISQQGVLFGVLERFKVTQELSGGRKQVDKPKEEVSDDRLAFDLFVKGGGVAEMQYWNKLILRIPETISETDYDYEINAKRQASYSQGTVKRRYSNADSAMIQTRYRLERRYVQFFDIMTQVPQYINLWKQTNPKDTDPKLDYFKVINELPGLAEMITNPFILWIVMFALPKLLLKYRKLSRIDCYHLTRLHLFDEFTSAWFERQADKLYRNGQINEFWRGSIEEEFRLYCSQLANCIWQSDDTKVRYLPQEDKKWDQFFGDGNFDNNPNKSLSIIRRGALIRIIDGNNYTFLHHSLLGYFASRHVFESVASRVSIALGLEINKKLLTIDPDMIRLGVNYIEKDPEFESSLWEIIEDSKHDSRIKNAAANAMTILVAANKSFVGRNLDHIRVPHANASGGNFEGASMQDADLQGVNFSRAWLTRANLSGSCVDHIQTGELPWEELGTEIINCHYLPLNVGQYVVVTKKGWIIYDAKTHNFMLAHELRLLGSDNITASAFSLNGDRLLLGTHQGYLLYLDFHKRECLSKWKANESSAPVLSLALSPEGSQAVTSSSGQNVICMWIWNWKRDAFDIMAITEKQLRTVNVLAVSQDEQLVLSGSDDGIIRLFDTQELNCSAGWIGHTGAVDVLIFNQDNKYTFSGSKDRTIKCWKTAKGKCLQTYVGHTGDILALACSHDGLWLFSSAKDNTVRRWEVATGTCLSVWNEINNIATTLAISHDDNLLLSGFYDGKLKRWETLAGQCFFVGQGHTASVIELALYQDNSVLVSASKDTSVKLWIVEQGQSIEILKANTQATKLHVSTDKRWILAGSDNGEILRWDLITGKRINIYTGHQATISALAISTDKSCFFSGSSDKTIRCWAVDSKQSFATWIGHTDTVTSLVLSSHHPWVYSSSRDATIRCWNISNNECLTVWSQHCAPITTLAMSHEGDWLLSGSESGEIIRYLLPAGDAMPVWKGHEAKINTLAIGPGTSWAMSSDDNNNIILWDVVEGLVHARCALPCPVTELQWSSVGRNIIIIGMADGSISAWSLDSQFAKLHLIWRSNPWGLVAKDAKFLSAHGLAPLQERILQQRGMKIQNSSKSSEKILLQRQKRIRYSKANPHRGLFDSSLSIREDRWIVSIVRKKKGAGSRHAFLLLESVEDGYYCIRRIEFVLELRQSMLPIDARKPKESDYFGQGLIEMEYILLSDTQNFVEQHCALTSVISMQKGTELLENIRRDQEQKIGYSLPGAGSPYTFFRMKEAAEHHNCFSWCKMQLEKVKIHLVEDRWLDGLLIDPSRRIRDNREFSEDNYDDEFRSGDHCSLM